MTLQEKDIGTLYLVSTYACAGANSCQPDDAERYQRKIEIRVQNPTREYRAACPVAVDGGAGGRAGVDLKLRENVDRLQGIIQAMSRQLVMQQLQAEEWVRTKGGSGLVQVRSYNGGTEDYFNAGVFNSNGIAAIHHHPNFERTMGLGEFVASLNGVQFWTRHNDYLFRMNCPDANVDNSIFARSGHENKVWTDFPLYKEAYEYVRNSQLDVNGVEETAEVKRKLADSAMRYVCLAVCKAEPTISVQKNENFNTPALKTSVRQAIMNEIKSFFVDDNTKASLYRDSLGRVRQGGPMFPDNSKGVDGDVYGYGCTTEVPYPSVPDSVLAKSTVSEQVEEMRQYFKAFKEQDESIRADYKDYFKANLCYLEGQWENQIDEVKEPFKSDRHEIDAKNWVAVNQRMRFLQSSGRKHNLENLPFLPNAARNVKDSGEPEMAQWTYRIVCHPLKEDLPTSRFILADDLQALWFSQSGATSEEIFARSPQARFKIDPRASMSDPKQETYAHEFLDTLMEQVPGRDGYGYSYTDDVPTSDGNVQRARNFVNPTDDLNAAYYSRHFKVKDSKAKEGFSPRRRGLNDPTLWAAKTEINARNVSGLSLGNETSRWSYAVPLEIVYTSPLFDWNPYGIAIEGDNSKWELETRLNEDDRNIGNDGDTPDKAWKDTNPFEGFFQTPLELFTNKDMRKKDKDEQTEAEKANTGMDPKYVLDSGGTARKVVASGNYINLPYMDGVGFIRMRYPVVPLHDRQNTIWKEVKALEDRIKMERQKN